jgi:hypothetical protein
MMKKVRVSRNNRVSFSLPHGQVLGVFQLCLETESCKRALRTLAHKSLGNSIGTEAILADWVLEKVQDAFDRFDWARSPSDKRWLLPHCATVFLTWHFSTVKTDCFSLYTSSYTKIWVHWPVSRQLIKLTCHVSTILYTFLLKFTLQIFLQSPRKFFKRVSQGSRKYYAHMRRFHTCLRINKNVIQIGRYFPSQFIKQVISHALFSVTFRKELKITFLTVDIVGRIS